MNSDFIKAGINSRNIHKAYEQEDQLAYFTMSEMQEGHLTSEYLSNWANRKYQTNDYFLNYVKSVFKTQNFLSFFKYLRKPLPSAKIINNKIAPQLKRMFHAENSFFKYSVPGADEIDYVELLKIKEFEHELFGRMLFLHNSLIVSDISEDKPYRYFVDIKDVLSISKDRNGDIDRVAFKGFINIDGKEEYGVVYVDKDVYEFYDSDLEYVTGNTHSLGNTPVHFISPKEIGKSWVLRESIFTYIREELEEYTFLKTLQKMTDPNGAIPIVTKLDVDILEDNDISNNERPAIEAMSSQVASKYGDNPNQGEGILQTGSVFEVPVIEKDSGGIDMEAVKNFITFHYIPTESLNYLNKRIKEIEESIVNTIVGGVINGLKEGSKNELQIEESLSVLQNTLIYFSESFNYVRKRSDSDMLRLKFGEIGDIYIFYGTDFFLDTESMLYANLERASNTIERRNILLRINQNRYKGNANKINRQKIVYDLLPYISDIEFDKAIERGVDDTTFIYQTRFNYWISQFEARYGDIVEFYKELDVTNAEKLNFINNLVIRIINDHKIREK